MKIDHKWSTKKKFLRFFSEELQIQYASFCDARRWSSVLTCV